MSPILSYGYGYQQFGFEQLCAVEEIRILNIDPEKAITSLQTFLATIAGFHKIKPKRFPSSAGTVLIR